MQTPVIPGNLFIITAASGAGKTSLVSALLAKETQISLSVSHTTRQPRSSERDGVHYHFVTQAQFMALLNAGGFLESADVHGAKYGTSQQAVDTALAAGRDVVLEIDWQGAVQVRRLYPSAVSIFILPPSLEALAQRLNSRGQDSSEVIALRLAVAREEMRHLAEFDYVIINEVFETALQELSAVVLAQRLKTSTQSLRHARLIQQLT